VIKVSSYKDVPMLREDFVNSVCQGKLKWIFYMIYNVVLSS
jgi:hypothetical protein